MIKEQVPKVAFQENCKLCEKSEQCPITEVIQKVNQLEAELNQMKKFNQEFHYNLDI